MKQNFIFLMLLLSSSAVTSASVNFEDTYGFPASADFSDLADQIVDTRFDQSSMTLQQKLSRLKNLQIRIDSKLSQFGDDPLIWFLSGLNQNNLAEVQYLIILDKSGQQKASKDINVSNYNIARSRSYDNAIRLDSPQPHQLSSSIYATMGYGLSNRQKVKTYSRELELGSPAENESNEWFMHWAKIDVLVHEKKIDEAQQALQELKQLLKQRKKTDSAYSSIVDRAETQVASEVKTSENRKAVSTSKPIPSSLEHKNDIGSWGWETWLLIGFGLFTFMFVVIAAVYLRKG
ncbi:MAG: hypothetical protein GY806_16180 [Gammaproteobacteria bacterium]|nr:hypothetical protein [Gammaproteobacteria bacterium]